MALIGIDLGCPAWLRGVWDQEIRIGVTLPHVRIRE